MKFGTAGVITVVLLVGGCGASDVPNSDTAVDITQYSAVAPDGSVADDTTQTASPLDACSYLTLELAHSVTPDVALAELDGGPQANYCSYSRVQPIKMVSLEIQEPADVVGRNADAQTAILERRAAAPFEASPDSYTTTDVPELGRFAFLGQWTQTYAGTDERVAWVWWLHDDRLVSLHVDTLIGETTTDDVVAVAKRVDDAM